MSVDIPLYDTEDQVLPFQVGADCKFARLRTVLRKRLELDDSYDVLFHCNGKLLTKNTEANKDYAKSLNDHGYKNIQKGYVGIYSSDTSKCVTVNFFTVLI